MKFDVLKFDVPRFDEILKRGLSLGVGDRNGQMCIEAAICTVLDLPHGDDPGCVAKSVRSFKICLNDKPWSSPEARAAGLRDLGLAQLGSLGVVVDKQFVTILAKKTIQVLLPAFIRKVYPHRQDLLEATNRCEAEGTKESARALARIAYAAANAAANAVAYVAYAAAYDAAYAAANAVAYVADAAAAAAAYNGDEFLLLSAKLALDTLKELNSPGCALL